MATYEQLMEGARRADAAGDGAGARRFLELALEAKQPAMTGADAMRARGLSSPDPTSANAEALAAMQPGTNIVEQTGSGINDGIAGMAGLPVDMVNKGLGLVGMGSDRPVMGSEWLRDGPLDPFTSDMDPQTGAQRVARRVGNEIGAGAIAGPAMGVRTLGGMALNTLSDTGAGLGASAANAVAPDSALAEIAGALIGGGIPVAGAYGVRSGPQAPSMDDLRRTQADAYSRVEASPARLTDAATDELRTRTAARMQAENADPYLHPRATRTTERIGELDQPTIYEVEQRRRLAGRDVAGSQDASERELGVALKGEIDRVLRDLDPSKVTGSSNVDDVIEALNTGRATTQRIKKAEAIADARYRAENRAATSGTGGNEINATRQNLRSILDNPKKSRGFSEAELQAIEDVVRGTPAANAARMVGRLSPTSGALPMMASGIGGAAGAGATGNPLFLLPGAIGAAAKKTGEVLTERQINNLEALMRNGAPLATKTMTDAERAVVQALLAQQGATYAQQ